MLSILKVWDFLAFRYNIFHVTVITLLLLTIQILTETDAVSVTTIFLDNTSIFHRPKRDTCVGFCMKSLSVQEIQYKENMQYVYKNITN
jgi:hypothetical protein